MQTVQGGSNLMGRARGRVSHGVIAIWMPRGSHYGLLVDALLIRISKEAMIVRSL